MMFSIASSRTARSPRAPVFRFWAIRTIARSASSVNSRRTFSISKNFWYCLTIAFFGCVRIVEQRLLVQIGQATPRPAGGRPAPGSART